MSTVPLDNPTGDALVFDTPAGLVPSVAEADPVTGAPADRATETTLAALKAVADTLATAAAAIQSAVEALDAKATAIDTGAIAGTVSLDGATLAALEAFTQGVFIDPASGRLRVVLDALGGAQTLNTVTTVGQLAGVPANSVVYDVIDTAWANCLRGRIQ